MHIRRTLKVLKVGYSQIQIQVNLCQKLLFLQNMRRTCCVQKLFLTFRTIFLHNMFSPCSAKRRASDKDLPVQQQQQCQYSRAYREGIVGEMGLVLLLSHSVSPHTCWYYCMQQHQLSISGRTCTLSSPVYIGVLCMPIGLLLGGS